MDKDTKIVCPVCGQITIEGCYDSPNGLRCVKCNHKVRFLEDNKRTLVVATPDPKVKDSNVLGVS